MCVSSSEGQSLVPTLHAAGLAARLFVPSDVLGTPRRLPLLVYFHGGGFALHWAFAAAHSRLLNALVSAARVVAVSVDYRLAPEHPLPAAYDDAWAALVWAVSSCCAAGPVTEEPWLSAHADVARLAALFLTGDRTLASAIDAPPRRSAVVGADAHHRRVF
nr:unnamed protein product [Digitaria exilis]